MISKEFVKEEEKYIVDILNDLFKKNDDAVIITDFNFDIIYINPAVDKIAENKRFGPGQNLFLFYPEINLLEDEQKKLLRGGSFRILIKRNHFSLDCSASPMTLADKKLFIFILRKRVALKKRTGQQSIFKPLIQQSPIATAIFNPSGKPIYMNSAYGELFSISKEHSSLIMSRYNILNDEQLIEAGLLPFIKKSLTGQPVEFPTIIYNPVKTKVLRSFGVDIDKYIKGNIFPVKDENDNVKEIVIVLSDVTYQKQAEQILTEAHLKFQMLNLNLPAAIYEYEINPDLEKGRFIYMSQGCKEIFGFAPEKIMQDENIINRMIHPDDLVSYEESVKSTRFGPWEWEGRVSVNGAIKWIEARSSLRIQPDGRRISYGVLMDVTEKKKAEEQFRTAEERLRLALQSADISLWEWQEKTGKVYLNKHWAVKLGYNKEELQEKINSWHSLVHPDDRQQVDDLLNDLIAGKSDNYEAEYRLLCKSGEWSWMLDRGKAVIRCPNGKALKITGTQLDITERKRSEAIIKKNEQLFTQLFENSPLGIVLLDESHKVVQINKGFEDMFGFYQHDVFSSTLNNFIVPKECMEESHKINILTGNGNVGKLESVRKKRNGELVPVLIYGVPVILNKKTIGIYAIYVDISDRKKTERELQIRNNELDNFVYKVSHDLRAPLSSILGLVNLANIQSNTDDLRTYINLIGQRVRQLDAFIGDVLSHSKNLKLELSVDKIDFQEMIQRCFRELNYLPGADKIKHNVSISGMDFYSDQWRINEVFRNLISNAIKYMNPEQPEPYISVEIKSSAKSVKIKFADNGLGIDKNLQHKIFEMFYRATVHSEGSGIGLYIVKNAIEKLNGTIEVASELQKGTTFTIRIPNRKKI